MSGKADSATIFLAHTSANRIGSQLINTYGPEKVIGEEVYIGIRQKNLPISYYIASAIL